MRKIRATVRAWTLRAGCCWSGRSSISSKPPSVLDVLLDRYARPDGSLLWPP